MPSSPHTEPPAQPESRRLYYLDDERQVAQPSAPPLGGLPKVGPQLAQAVRVDLVAEGHVRHLEGLLHRLHHRPLDSCRKGHK